MDYSAIGQRIRQLRRERGLSQETLAECAEISPTHMSHIETASTKLSLPVLAALAQRLSVSTDYLLYGSSANTHEEVDAVLDTCSESPIQILAEVVKSTKAALDRYAEN